MAGPFASTGNQASEIQATPAIGGGAPQTSALVEGVEKLANIIIPVVRENRTSEITTAVNEETASVRDFLKLARNPELLTSDFGIDAVNNPAVRQALADFVDVRNERDQGILPSRFALERLEVIQNDAIANAPEFAQEIRMAMMAATGQDPSKTLFAQLLRPKAAAEKTPEEKAQEQMRFEAERAGVSVEMVELAGRAEFENAFKQDTYQIKKRNGTESLEDITASANLFASTAHGRILQAVNLAVRSPEGLTPEKHVQFLTQMNLDIIQMEQQVIKGLKGRYSQKEMDDALGGLYRWRDSMRQIMKDNELGNLIGNKTALKQTLIMNEFMKDPESAAAYTMGGPKMYAELEKLFSMKGNRMMGDLRKSLFPAAKAAAEAGETGTRALSSQNDRGTSFGMPSKPQVIRQFTFMGDGNMDSLAPVDKTARRVAANLTLRTPEVNGERMEAAVQDLDDDYGWRAIQNSKVIAAARKHPVLARRVNVLVGNQIGALSFDYVNDVATLDGFNANRFSIEGGQLVYKLSSNLGKNKTAADFEVPVFVKRFNMTMSVAERYSRVGVLDATKFTTQEAFFKTIQTAVKQQQKEELAPEPDTGIPEFIRNADGTITLKRG